MSKHRLKRKGIGNEQASWCKWLKHSSSALYFALANIFVIERSVLYLLYVNFSLSLLWSKSSKAVADPEEGPSTPPPLLKLTGRFPYADLALSNYDRPLYIFLCYQEYKSAPWPSVECSWRYQEPYKCIVCKPILLIKYIMAELVVHNNNYYGFSVDHAACWRKHLKHMLCKQVYFKHWSYHSHGTETINAHSM